MASLSDQLRQIKLRKVSENDKKDFSSPKKAGYITKEEISNYQSSVLEVNIEQWMDILQDVTFKTEVCPFNFEEAQLFLRIYERTYKDIDPLLVARKDWKQCLDVQEMKTISDIESRLQTTMINFSKDRDICSEGFFVKLSSRSPKDAPLYQEKLKSLFIEELNSKKEETRKDDNTQLWCMLRACFLAMRVHEAATVLDMLARSERVYQDLLLATAHQDRYSQHFVVRQFVDIDVDMEFRGFVFNGALTALSQYNYLLYSDRLAEEKAKLQSVMTKFFAEEVKAKLQDAEMFPKSFIIDFAVCRGSSSLDEAHVWVIEINPFLETTDGALFSWEHEKHILQGKSTFEFRITERPRKGAKNMLPYSAKQILKSLEE